MNTYRSSNSDFRQNSKPKNSFQSFMADDFERMQYKNRNRSKKNNKWNKHNQTRKDDPFSAF